MLALMAAPAVPRICSEPVILILPLPVVLARIPTPPTIEPGLAEPPLTVRLPPALFSAMPSRVALPFEVLPPAPQIEPLPVIVTLKSDAPAALPMMPVPPAVMLPPTLIVVPLVAPDVWMFIPFAVAALPVEILPLMLKVLT